MMISPLSFGSYSIVQGKRVLPHFSTDSTRFSHVVIIFLRLLAGHVVHIPGLSLSIVVQFSL